MDQNLQEAPTPRLRLRSDVLKRTLPSSDKAKKATKSDKGKEEAVAIVPNDDDDVNDALRDVESLLAPVSSNEQSPGPSHAPTHGAHGSPHEEPDSDVSTKQQKKVSHQKTPVATPSASSSSSAVVDERVEILRLWGQQRQQLQAQLDNLEALVRQSAQSGFSSSDLSHIRTFFNATPLQSEPDVRRKIERVIFWLQDGEKAKTLNGVAADKLREMAKECDSLREKNSSLFRAARDARAELKESRAQNDELKQELERWKARALKAESERPKEEQELQRVVDETMQVVDAIIDKSTKLQAWEERSYHSDGSFADSSQIWDDDRSFHFADE